MDLVRKIPGVDIVDDEATYTYNLNTTYSIIKDFRLNNRNIGIIRTGYDKVHEKYYPLYRTLEYLSDVKIVYNRLTNFIDSLINNLSNNDIDKVNSYSYYDVYTIEINNQLRYPSDGNYVDKIYNYFQKNITDFIDKLSDLKNILWDYDVEVYRVYTNYYGFHSEVINCKIVIILNYNEDYLFNDLV